MAIALAIALLPVSKNAVNSSSVAPVASSTLASDSVEGQRSRPSGLSRLDLLNAVGSSPALAGKPRRRQVVSLGKRVDRTPDRVM